MAFHSPIHESGGERMMEEDTTAQPMFINAGYKLQADAVATPPARTSPTFEASWGQTSAAFYGQRPRRRSHDTTAMKLQRNESCKVVPPGTTLLSLVSSVSPPCVGRR